MGSSRDCVRLCLTGPSPLNSNTVRKLGHSKVKCAVSTAAHDTDATGTWGPWARHTPTICLLPAGGYLVIEEEEERTVQGYGTRGSWADALAQIPTVFQGCHSLVSAQRCQQAGIATWPYHACFTRLDAGSGLGGRPTSHLRINLVSFYPPVRGCILITNLPGLYLGLKHFV